MAEEVLSGIRTVFAFGGEKAEIERYNERLASAKQVVRMKGLVTGVGDGIMRFLFFAAYALGYWYGAKLVLDDRDKVDKEYTPAVLMVVCMMPSDRIFFKSLEHYSQKEIISILNRRFAA